MDPAQAMLADIELAGVVADDHGVAQEAVGLDAAPQGAFGGDQHRIGIDLEGGDAELFKMRVPGPLVGEAAVGMFGQAVDHLSGQRAFAHIGECRGIDDVIAMAGAQQGEEVEAALRPGGANQVKCSLPIWVQKPFFAWWRAPVSSTVIQAALVSPARSTSRASARKPSWPSLSRRTTWRLEMRMPSVRNSVTSRGAVVWP